MFTPAASDSLFLFLIASSLKVTFVFACAGALVFALRRNSSALRHHVWASAILASLLLPLFTLFLPAWHSSTLGNATAALYSPHASATSAPMSALPPLIINAASSANVFSKFGSVILLLWFLGFSVIAFRLLGGLARLAWVAARAKPLFEDAWMHEVLNLSGSLKISRAVRLLECPSAQAMPLTCGLFRPVIILPAGSAQWDADRRRVVLSHELAHIARNDWCIQICGELARAIYWFHPLVWLAAAQLRHESERACDDAVLLSGVAPSHYASQLLDLARTLGSSGRAWSTALAIARPSHLERRFAAMLNPSLNRRRLSPKVKFLIPLFAAGILIPLAALRLPAQNLSGKVSGTIHDPSGAAVQNATIIMSHHAADIEGMTIDMTTSDRDGNFAFKALPAGDYELKVLKPGFATFRSTEVTLEPSRDFSQNVGLEIGEITEQVHVVPNGSANSLPYGADAKPARIRLGGNVEAAKLIKPRVMPLYPETAKAAGTQGTVILHAVISKDGRPLSLRVMNSQVDPDLAKSAVEAVSQWRYTPTLLNGEPVEIDTTIDVVYSLQP